MLLFLLFAFQTVDDSLETTEENEEDFEYIVERLETDDENMIGTQTVKDETGELVGEEEEREKEIDNDLCAQLQSDDENNKPVIKKIKLMHEV